VIGTRISNVLAILGDFLSLVPKTGDNLYSTGIARQQNIGGDVPRLALDVILKGHGRLLLDS
jgi:hypothetical protein